MKNNIVFKFIAIILCAASLLGAVGGIAGVAVLTSGDLYNKTVPQVRAERVQSNALHYADTLAQQYTSTQLGACPEGMAADAFTSGSWFTEVYPRSGYTILDAEGNVLSTHNADLTGSTQTFTFQPTGKYMHLVSVESDSEKAFREQQERAAKQPEAVSNANEIPDEGIALTHVFLYDENMAPVYAADYYDNELHITYFDVDSSSGYTEYSHFEAAGYLIVNQKNQLIYSSYSREDFEALPDRSIHAADFANDREGFYYQIDFSQKPIGRISRNSTGRTIFQSFAPEQPVVTAADSAPMLAETIDPEEPVVTFAIEPVEESAPVTEALAETTAAAEEPVNTTAPIPVEESIPPVTVPLETTPPETVVQETVPSSASAPPEETHPTEPVFTAPPVLPDPTEAPVADPIPDPTALTEAILAATEPIVVETMPQETVVIPETAPEETIPAQTEPILINGKTLDNYQVNTHRYWDAEAQEWMTAKFVYLPMPELTVELYVDEASMQDAYAYDLLEIIRQYRGYLLPAIGVCLLVFAIFAVYLCTAAGRKPKTDEVRAGGLNRIPLDLYLCGAGFAAALCIVYAVEGFRYLTQQNLLVACCVSAGLSFLACLIFVAFCFAFVAQIKTPGGFWWRNTLCGHCIRLFMRFGVWLERFLGTKFFPWLGRSIKWLWRFSITAAVWCYHAFETSILWIGNKCGCFFRWFGKKLHRFLSMLPLTWQWVVVGLFWFCMILIACNTYNDGLTLFCLAGTIALVLYIAHCFGLLSESTKRMSKGDLDTKVDDKLMVGCFKDFAGDLNDLADVAVVAAQKQLKSERMKTELITNVSHDIKTPLTSIINYVDLLQKPHTEEEEQQYLEVLDRQSQRLKKLIDDLMDMSKANTGNMQVDITRVDAVESVNQALGEFADKLSRAQLIPVFRHDDPSVPMMADGRLVWRVLSNLLGNAVKYAMPGTRLYLDLMTLEGKVILSLKNISREELNVDADELMERFVRGDDSRNTEGSGLGLNIAKSLMELQKGQLQLLVDGDLFKVTLIFPGA